MNKRIEELLKIVKESKSRGELWALPTIKILSDLCDELQSIIESN